MPERFIALGAIAKPHGVRGEVRVHRFNPDSALLEQQDTLYLKRGPDDVRPIRVEAARAHGDAVLVKLAGVDTREAADALRGVELCVPRSALPELEQDEVYHADLVGLQARLENGEGVGEVVSVISYPAADCLLVRGPDGDREVPFLTPYVVEVDLAKRALVLAHLDDLEVRRPRR